MLKIGDFSKLARVTVKTLHHYESLGLLRPAWIDRFSGYRYYTLQQLPDLNRILALKDLGFSLEEIGWMIQQNMSVDELRGLLTRKQEELEQRVSAEQRRLAMVAIRLDQMEQAPDLDRFPVVVKSTPDEMVAVVHGRAPSLDMVPACSEKMYQQIVNSLGNNSLRLTPEWFTLHNNPEYVECRVDIETAAVLDPTARQKPEAGRIGDVSVRSLPAIEECASLVTSLHPADMFRAYNSLYTWVETNGYKVNGAVRETYLQDNDEAQERMVEVQFPIERNHPWWKFHTLRDEKKDSTMDVKIITQPAMTLVGLPYQGANKNSEIAEVWEEFYRRADEIPHQRPTEFYGVCRVPPGLPEGDFEYCAGVPVEKVESLPEGMIKLELPELKCAVIPMHGLIEENLGQAYTDLYEGWLPQSGYSALEAGFDMEVYGKEFNPESKDSVMYIHLPLK
jgi:predicted transcriptional regulator YdeE/DNA-binding transcriptional MerR regulator